MDDGRLLVVCKDDSSLEVIDLEMSRAAGAVLASGFTPHEVVATRDGRRAYMPVYGDTGVGSAGSDGQRVDVVDLLTFQLVGAIRLPFPSRPHQSGLLPNGRVIVSTELDESVSVIDPRTLRVVARLPTGQAESHTFAVSVDGRRLVTANVGPGSVSVIDVPSRRLRGVVPVAGKVNRICLEPDGRLGYTADQGSPRIAVIDAQLIEQVASIELPSIGFGTAVTSGGSHLVVALRTASEIAVVDLRSREVVHRVATPDHPQAIVLHPDGVRAYSACDAAACVVEVDIRAGRLLRRMETGRNPDGIAWCPRPTPASKD
ncbi:DNA-binding beta-propeller fold protein YncE [Agromyces ramosus]|uniref:DNA-binding beta-propeller fold protein YncE n=1 Tax=Agromyces ramosus TaxID=33879 RepID=A0A4Q7M8P3_9MICO|nr:YncE family protein [Agromyces ramosus]RZS64386.1 DNA-binding beta-propeller fold protein YncE [Agromyces ramosus]